MLTNDESINLKYKINIPGYPLRPRSPLRPGKPEPPSRPGIPESPFAPGRPERKWVFLCDYQDILRLICLPLMPGGPFKPNQYIII
jgi:hypothetical protein